MNPHGTIIFEAFSKNHLNYQKLNPGVGGPKMPNQLYDSMELSNDFERFDMVAQRKVIELAEYFPLRSIFSSQDACKEKRR